MSSSERSTVHSSALVVRRRTEPFWLRSVKLLLMVLIVAAIADIAIRAYVFLSSPTLSARTHSQARSDVPLVSIPEGLLTGYWTLTLGGFEVDVVEVRGDQGPPPMLKVDEAEPVEPIGEYEQSLVERISSWPITRHSGGKELPVRCLTHGALVFEAVLTPPPYRLRSARATWEYAPNVRLIATLKPRAPSAIPKTSSLAPPCSFRPIAIRRSADNELTGEIYSDAIDVDAWVHHWEKEGRTIEVRHLEDNSKLLVITGASEPDLLLIGRLTSQPPLVILIRGMETATHND